MSAFSAGNVVRTKLAPPQPQKYTLIRPRIQDRLREGLDHRLTILQAGTGFGKSTALAGLNTTNIPLIWYRLDDEDADPQRFLLHLLYGFGESLPISQTPLALLEEWSLNRPTLSWTAVVDALINESAATINTPTFLILDDVHLIQESSLPVRILDRLIGRAPAHLHIILASRYPVPLPTLVSWRVKGMVLEIGQDELAFTGAEIDHLFRHHFHYPLTLEQAALLINRIEGWPIALQLIWQQLQRDGGASLAQALTQLSGSASDLFVYLTQEVLTQQPEDIQAFLRETAVLRRMTAASCDFLRQQQDSEQILRFLFNQGLFILKVGGEQYRYHHLFRELLKNQLDTPTAQRLQAQAAAYYQTSGDDEETIYHLLAAKAYDDVAALLAPIGRQLVQMGRLDTLAAWIEALPPQTLTAHPPLLAYRGDIERLHSRFDEALRWYQQAEQFSRLQNDTRALGQALRGQARVYLDTVNAARADELLQEALRLSDRQEDRQTQARLRELLAENLLNRGRTEEAQKYQAEARALRERTTGELPIRMMLRTGRLEEARQLLTAQAHAEAEAPVLRPRAHREPQLLLSLVHAFLGHPDEALETAQVGTRRGQKLDAKFITSVGFSRQGHAYLLYKDSAHYETARNCFQEALALSKAIDVPRLEVEPYWGLVQIHGFRGDLQTALDYALQAINLVQADGDEWVEMCVRLTMGAAYALAGEYKNATQWLNQALTGFHNCSDTYGECVARLWQCHVWQCQNDETRLKRDLPELFSLLQNNPYEFLFTRRTLIGPPDPRLIFPILLFARGYEKYAPYAERLLQQIGLPHVQIHPGYQLKVYTLGSFRIWQGDNEVASKAWQRRKARQLFQLLVVYRDRMLHRDQIAALLWPDLEEEGAIRDFKIAFSAMCSVLEPNRRRNTPSAYVARDGSRYGLQLDADLWLDVVDFENHIASGDRVYGRDNQTAHSHYQKAFALYEGDFLQAYPYEAWCHEEREQLQAVYLRMAERLAQGYIARAAWDDVIHVCHAILIRDDCWETAYQMMMTAYQQLGNRSQVARTYQRCVAALERSMGISPSAYTTQIFENIH